MTTDQSAAVCPVCGARRALLQRYCNSCEEVATDCVYLALSIRRFVRRAEVAEAARNVCHATSGMIFTQPLGRVDEYNAFAVMHHKALQRLAELALEDR